MTAKHVCLIGPIPPPWGGVETHMMTLRDHIRSIGWRCSIINVTRHRQEDHDDLYFPDSAKGVLACLNAIKPDVVHVHFGGSLFVRQALLFVALSFRRKSANVFTFHSGGFPSSDEGKRARWFSLRGFALRRLDAVIGVNKELMETFARYGVRQERLHLVAPFAPDLDVAAIRSEQLPENIAAFADAHSPFLATVAGLEPEYGIDVQIAAFSAIRAEFPNVGLAILGSGSQRETVEALIARHPNRAHILLAGNVPRPKTLAVIARTDLLLRTTHYDGDAMSVREALAIGTPVLATDNGMRPEGVRLVSMLSPDALAAAVTAAVRDVIDGQLSSAPDVTKMANPMRQLVDLYQGF
jgi:glycogen(starch) synthase